TENPGRTTSRTRSANRGDQPSGATACGLTSGWVIALVAMKACGTTPPNKSCSSVMPRARAVAGPTSVSHGTKYTGRGYLRLASYTSAKTCPLSMANFCASATWVTRSCIFENVLPSPAYRTTVPSDVWERLPWVSAKALRGTDLTGLYAV